MVLGGDNAIMQSVDRSLRSCNSSSISLATGSSPQAHTAWRMSAALQAAPNFTRVPGRQSSRRARYAASALVASTSMPAGTVESRLESPPSTSQPMSRPITVRRAMERYSSSASLLRLIADAATLVTRSASRRRASAKPHETSRSRLAGTGRHCPTAAAAAANRDLQT